MQVIRVDKEWAELEPYTTVFSTRKWLDLIGEPYRLWGVYKGREIVGGLVDCDSVDVKLTPYHGIVAKSKSYEYPVAKALADTTGLNIINHYSMTDIRPFLWKGYKPVLRYTYITGRDVAYEKDTRYEIGKAAGREITEGTIEQFWSMYQETFIRKVMKPPVDYNWLQEFNEIMRPKIYMIGDLAGAVIISDKHRGYYIFGASTKDAQNTGASSAVLCYAISLRDEVDLVGCNNESVALFKRGFAKELKVCLGVER